MNVWSLQRLDDLDKAFLDIEASEYTLETFVPFSVENFLEAYEIVDEDTIDTNSFE